MLTPAEQVIVQGAIADAIAVDGRPQPFIIATFGNRAQALLLAVPTSLSTVDQHAAFVLGQCLDARWPPPPDRSLMEMMLAALIGAGAAPALVAMRDRVQRGEVDDPNPDPVKTLWVNETMPFFSRSTLRPVVKTFLNRDIQPILRIIGPSAAGKSYSRWLIHHVIGQRTDQRVLLAEVSDGAGPSYTVEELVEELLTTVPHPNMPPRATSNYPAAVSRWILNTVTNTQRRSILVLDGFNQRDLLEETRELVRNLAQRVGGANDVRKLIRLVLIDYDGSLPVPLGTVTSDTVPDPTTVTADDVAACLSAHYTDLANRGRPRGGITPAVLTVTAEGLLADARASGTPNLQALNDMLTKLRLDDLQQV